MIEESVVAPALAWVSGVSLGVAASAPSSISSLGVPVGPEGPVTGVAASRDALVLAGFTGQVGKAHAIPGADGPLVVALGAGAATPDSTAVRTIGAAFGRATRNEPDVAVVVDGLTGSPEDVAAALVEGILLARYAYEPLRTRRRATPLASVTLVSSDASALDASERGAERGRSFAKAAVLARDLANCPHNFLSASDLADFAAGLAGGPLTVEVFDKEQLIELGCGGLLGVNAGSAEPPRMVKLTYTPEGEPTGRLALVGKGIMYDSGGIALKPGDTSHSQMKNDMSGAAAVLAAMYVLRELGGTAAVTGYLMCTDNMPSGTATALGDVITMRDGTTVEVVNTDAEGRLVMADALCLAVEAEHEAIVDIATLTGACLRALGTQIAGVIGNDATVIDGLRDAATVTGESVWELPLETRYRAELDTPVADIKNLGGANAGAITAALFLAEFVGGLPRAHLDIAGTAQSDGDKGWLTEGCTGFGARLLAEYARRFTTPAATASNSDAVR